MQISVCDFTNAESSLSRVFTDPIEKGEYLATMLWMDWKYNKEGYHTMIVEFRTDKGWTGKAIFPEVHNFLNSEAKVNNFFASEAKQACEVLLGVSEPTYTVSNYELVYSKVGTRFNLLVENHEASHGGTTQYFLIRENPDVLIREEPVDTAEGLVAYIEKTLDRMKAKSRKERFFLELKYAHYEAYEAMEREMLKEELRKEVALEGA